MRRAAPALLRDQLRDPRRVKAAPAARHVAVRRSGTGASLLTPAPLRP